MNWKHYILSLVFSFGLLSLTITAQSNKKPASLKEKGEQYYANERYKDALPFFLKYEKSKSKDVGNLFKIGLCYLYTNQFDNAEKYFLKVSKKRKRVPANINYALARTYHLQHRFDEAVEKYKQYLSEGEPRGEERKSIKADISRCGQGIKLQYKDDIAVIDNLGTNVNSTGDDYAPKFSPNHIDKLYFASGREGNAGGLRNKKGERSRFGKYRSDVFTAELKQGEWTIATPFQGGYNTNAHETVIGFSDDAKRMIFMRGTAKKTGRIFSREYRGEDEEPAINEFFDAPFNAEKWDGTIHTYNDSILIFSTALLGGYGGKDLFVSIRKNGTWTKPTNLGSPINTSFDEITPFLAVDGRTLYYSSDNTNSMGGFDFFKATFEDESRVWSSPENLGMPINSAGDETHLTISVDGLRAFFSSSRKDGLGERDIYAVYFRKSLTEQKTTSDPLVFAQVKDKEELIADNQENNTTKPVTFSPEDIKEYKFSPIIYKSDLDLLAPTNKYKLRDAIALAREYPQLKIVLTSHTPTRTQPVKFNIYFALKEAEKVAQYMVENGVKPENVILKSCGDAYPIAMNTKRDGSDNLIGQNLNRRIDIEVLNTKGLPISTELVYPSVSKIMALQIGDNYRKRIKGLSYKVEIKRQDKMYDGDLPYSDIMIETNPKTTYLNYTVGLFSNFSTASLLRTNLEAKGFLNAQVIPYMNGIRIPVARIEAFSELYPDLKNFIKAE